MTPFCKPSAVVVTAVVAAMLLSIIAPTNSLAAVPDNLKQQEDTADFLMYGALALVGVALIVAIIKVGDSEGGDRESTEPAGPNSEGDIGGDLGDGFRFSASGDRERAYSDKPSVVPVCGFGPEGTVVGVRLGF